MRGLLKLFMSGINPKRTRNTKTPIAPSFHATLPGKAIPKAYTLSFFSLFPFGPGACPERSRRFPVSLSIPTIHKPLHQSHFHLPIITQLPATLYLGIGSPLGVGRSRGIQVLGNERSASLRVFGDGRSRGFQAPETVRITSRPSGPSPAAAASGNDAKSKGSMSEKSKNPSNKTRAAGKRGRKPSNRALTTSRSRRKLPPGRGAERLCNSVNSILNDESDRIARALVKRPSPAT